jgi:hypothetical protein
MPTRNAAYMADYRARNRDYVIRQRKLTKARQRAMEAVAKIHRTEFAKLYEQYRKEEGVG